jgi:CRP-like cAMP-binding protein
VDVNTAELLHNVSFFDGLSDAQLDAIAGIASVKKFSKGEKVFAEGATGEEFFIVSNGTVAINKNIAGGRKRNLSNMHEGDVFGELSLFDSEPRSADAEVMEDAELIVLPNSDFLGLLENDRACANTIKSAVISILCTRLRRTDEMLKEGVIWGFSMEF